jgi:VIT1/CCC1 family predicted Fe2+/Mn2+ transporter
MKSLNSRYNYLIAVGVSFVIAGIFMIALQLINAKISSGILSIGITMIIVAVFRKIRGKTIPEKDERIRKLAMYGLGYSWITTFLVITIFFWFDYFGLIKITTQQYYSVVFFTMIISAVIFQKLLYKKGDVK